MATADIQEYLSERDWGHKLFSTQYCREMLLKVVSIDGVVQKFIDSETISEDERKSLCDKKVADQKLRRLQTILTEHCNRNDLQALKTFIDILRDTRNVYMAQRLSLIYDERVNYFATLRLLLKEKALVRNLENEISRLQRILEEKERYLETLTDQKNKHVIQKGTFREENLKLEEDILYVEKGIGELTKTINNLVNQVDYKSNVIRKRDIEIAEKEREVREAIEESDRLRSKIDILQQQHSKAMVEDNEMSTKIELLEKELAEKENTIMNFRKTKTIPLAEVEKEFRNMNKRNETKMDNLNEKFDALAYTVLKALKLQENQ